MSAFRRLPEHLIIPLKIILVFLLLDVFFVSISMMGAFKDIGSGYGRELMNNLAHNPFIGLLLGVLVTSVIQSSSTTTSLVVGLVAGGALGNSPAEAIELAVPIVMGANIGTSVTNTIVSLTHMGNPNEFRRAFSCAIVHDFFNILAVIIFFPLQLTTNFLGWTATQLTSLVAGSAGATFSSPIKLLVKPQTALLKKLLDSEVAIRFVIYAAIVFIVLHVLKVIVHRLREDANTSTLFVIAALGFGLLFSIAQVHDAIIFHTSTATFTLALALLFASMIAFVKIMRAMVVDGAEKLFHRYVFRNAWLGILFGLLITGLVQSSSVTTSIVIPLAGAGIINIRQVFPYTLGANVGTTVTALLAAASSGNATALTVAIAHFLFNIFGIVALYPFRKIPILLAEKFAVLATRSKFVPIIFILSLYIGIPVLLIVITS
jgi:solute carrier family 34 (sodium-dependent phosphate cotransporter)